ncbi:MAG: hypothetical protein R2715_22830 [Ilumatobacteraceae bacterium]
MMLKAAAGGGGRGMRLVRPGDDVEAAFETCRSEAERSPATALYAERSSAVAPVTSRYRPSTTATESFGFSAIGTAACSGGIRR